MSEAGGREPGGAGPSVRATRDPRLAARVVRRVDLHYADGGSAAGDRPRHVRAGSGLAWLGARAELVVAQDDASFLAVLDVAAGTARALPLEHVVGGRRIFEARLGNKKHKLDLEACARLPDGRVLVVGSGSLPVRERLVLVAAGERTADPHHAHAHGTLVDASALYTALRARADFAGSELNVEGAAADEGSFFLVNRGNGEAREGRRPVDAIAELALADVLSFLAGGPVPALRRVTAFDLGEAAGVRLTFTDVCPRGGALYFLAAAEASPNALDDGEVAGTAFGVIAPGCASARLGALLDEHGAPLRAKVEGLAWARPDGTGSRALAVVDRDDPDLPTELLELELEGL